MNSVILVGRLTRDPEVRYTASQLAIARFSVAVNRPVSRGNSQDANQPTADFINVVALGKTAETIERFFTKGKWIGVQGRLQNDNYTNKDGVTVYSYEVFADRIEFVGNKGEDGGSVGGAYSSQRPAADSRGASNEIPDGFKGLEDEDMPF